MEFLMDIHAAIKDIAANSSILCTRPWTSIEERSLKGDYRICCFINKNLGMIAKDSTVDILDLWKANEIIDIRRRFVSNRMHTVCPDSCSVLQYKTKINKKYTDFFHYDHAVYDTYSTEFKENREHVAEAIINNDLTPDIYPLRLKLHPTNICNLRCRMCMQDKSLKTQCNDNYFNNLYKLMPYLEELVVFGGEPFACPVTKDIIFSDEMKKHPHINYSTITNGTLLDEKMQDRLKRIRLGTISFSLDGCSKKTYEQVRLGASFEKTMHNIELFVRKRDNDEIIIRDIDASFVVQHVNYHEIADFVRFTHSLNIKCGFSMVTGFHELSDCIDEVSECILEGIHTATSLNEIETARQLQILYDDLPGYGKKIRRLNVVYSAMDIVGKDKAIYWIRRHNGLRKALKKIFRIE